MLPPWLLSVHLSVDDMEKKIENASGYQAAGIYGLLRTHERLDTREPTEIHASINIHAAAGLNKLAAMLSPVINRR